jgi:hypothetical protein
VTISRNEDWIQIAALNERDEILFTPQFLEVMGEIGWEAKAFAGHLLGLWYDPFEHTLDYWGDAKVTKDQPGALTGDLEGAQDVVEYWATIWAGKGKEESPTHEAGTGLGLRPEWYRDVLRSKLVSIRLPKRLMMEYREALKKILPEM